MLKTSSGAQRMAEPAILGSRLLPRRPEGHQSALPPSRRRFKPPPRQRLDSKPHVAARSQRLHLAKQTFDSEPRARTERFGNRGGTDANMELDRPGKTAGINDERREHVVQPGNSLRESHGFVADSFGHREQGASA